MKKNITKIGIGIAFFATIVLYIGSFGSYEQERIDGKQLFWQLALAVTLTIALIMVEMYRELHEDYVELSDEVTCMSNCNCHFLADAAEESYIPDEEFSFTEMPEEEAV